MDEKRAETMTLAADVVAAYVSNNAIAVADLPELIRNVHGALSGVGVSAPADVVEATAKVSAAQIRKSITPDALISFVDGRPYKTLKRHLTTQGLTIDEYKARYGLPADYPTTAPAYSEARSAMARAAGLGQQGRKPGTPAKVPPKPKARKA